MLLATSAVSQAQPLRRLLFGPAPQSCPGGVCGVPSGPMFLPVPTVAPKPLPKAAETPRPDAGSGIVIKQAATDCLPSASAPPAAVAITEPSRPVRSFVKSRPIRRLLFGG